MRSDKEVDLWAIKKATKEFRSLVSELLRKKPSERLGSTSGASEIKKHPFFAKCDWEEIALRENVPLYKPNVSSAKDTSLFRYDQAENAELEISPDS